MQLVWTPRARKQRQRAIDYIAQDSPRAALGQLERIEHQTDMLLEQPEIGRPGRVDGTRELVISHTPFIVVYRLRPKDARIEILHLLHGAQRWPPDYDTWLRTRVQEALDDPRPGIAHEQVMEETRQHIERKAGPRDPSRKTKN